MMHSGIGHAGNWLCGPGAYVPGPLGFIVNLLFWVLMIYLGVTLFQAVFGRHPNGTTTRLSILKQRYARGEINEEEYQRMKTELN